jgi:hypothetical protein
MKKINLILMCSVLLLGMAVCANAYVNDGNAVHWTGAGDAASWMDNKNWQDDPRLPDYNIPGWIAGNPKNPGNWAYSGNKGYAAFDNGSTINLNSSLPDGRIERLYIGGTTPTTVTLGNQIKLMYRFYGCLNSNEIGILNIPAGTGIVAPEASVQYLCYAGKMTINITGGDYNAPPMSSYLGNNVGSEGTINISSGRLITGNNTAGELYLGSSGKGRLFQTGGSVIGRKIFLGSATTNAEGYYEISGGSLFSYGYIAMQNGTSTFKIVGSAASIITDRFDVAVTDRMHKLQLVLDSGGVSPIFVMGDMTAGDVYDSARLSDLIIEVSAQNGVPVTAGQTFDVVKAVKSIIATTDGGGSVTVHSFIPGINFTYKVTTDGTYTVLRLTAVAAAQGCGDALHPYPAMDFTGPLGAKDCIVDFYDFADFAESWMERTFP